MLLSNVGGGGDVCALALLSFLEYVAQPRLRKWGGGKNWNTIDKLLLSNLTREKKNP